MEWLKAALFGLVEGITEWLPISSTGHLILLDEFVSLGQSESFMEMFDVVIQLGAILAVVVVFFGRLWPFRRPKKVLDTAAAGRHLEGYHTSRGWWIFDGDKILLWVKIFIACLPSILIGLPLDDWLNAHLYNSTVVAFMLILYGVFFIVVERRNSRTVRVSSVRELGFGTALGIGLFQVLALIPGTSRSGATILGGILLGASRSAAAEFTFYLAIPTMFGASLLKFMKFGLDFTSAEFAILVIGMVVAFLVSILTIRFLMNFVKKHSFQGFGWYRIILGAVVLVYFWLAA